MENLRIFIKPRGFYMLSGYDFAILAMDPYNQNKPKSVAQNIVLGEYKEACVIDPVFSLDDFQVQGLMDEMWKAGIRPTKQKDDAGVIEAMKEHLSDLRSVILNMLFPVSKRLVNTEEFNNMKDKDVPF